MFEKTLLIIKPDAYGRGLCGEILKRIERVGLRVTQIRISEGEQNRVNSHYPTDDEWLTGVGIKTVEDYQTRGKSVGPVFGSEDPLDVGKQIRQWLGEYLLSGPIVPCEVTGNRAVSVVRKIIGGTLPSDAQAGTIRGDFSTDSPDIAADERRPVHNLVHASGTLEEARRELDLWFPAETK